jgi:hypothetical protein
MTETPPSPRSTLTAEVRALLQVPDDATLAERHRRSTRERRRTGVWLGLALGLVFGGISQSINPLYLPDLPLYHPFPGPWLTTLLSMLLGGLLGWVSAWPENGLLGIFFGGLLGALALDTATLIETFLESGDLNQVGAALFFIALPMVASLVVVIAAFWWALNWRQRLRREKGPRWLFHTIPLVLVLLVGWLATTTAYPPDARTVLTRARDLIETGRSAAQPTDLPPALRAAGVTGFLEHAGLDYTLQWDRDPTNRYAIPRPLGPGGLDALVIVRFSDGWTLACLYTAPTAPPQCISLDG